MWPQKKKGACSRVTPEQMALWEVKGLSASPGVLSTHSQPSTGDRAWAKGAQHRSNKKPLGWGCWLGGGESHGGGMGSSLQGRGWSKRGCRELPVSPCGSALRCGRHAWRDSLFCLGRCSQIWLHHPPSLHPSFLLYFLLFSCIQENKTSRAFWITSSGAGTEPVSEVSTPKMLSLSRRAQ